MKSRWVGLASLTVVVSLLLGACTNLEPTRVGPLAADPVGTYEVVVDDLLADGILAELEAYGHVTERFDAINGVLIQAGESAAAALAGLPFVREIGSTAMRFASTSSRFASQVSAA